MEPEDIWYDSVREDPFLPNPSAEECHPAWADAGGLDEQPLTLSDSSVPKRAFEDARWAEVAHEAKFQRVCQSLPLLPWEQGGWRSIFNPSESPLADELDRRLQVAYGSEEACHLPPENLPFTSELQDVPSSGVKIR